MAFLTPLEAEAMALSLKIGVAAVAGGLVPAIAVARLLSRRDLPGRFVLSILVYLPLVLPPVVTGYALLLLFGRHGPIGAFLADRFGIVFAFRWTGAALAAAVMGFPLMVRAIQLGFEAVDRRLEQAAASLGAPPIAVFATVALPLAMPAVVAGALLGFVKSLGEFGATITFVSNIPGETETLPIAIYALLQVPGAEGAVLHLALLSVALSIAGLAASEWLGRRLGAAT
jgi:molybdate transport system permease protein